MESSIFSLVATGRVDDTSIETAYYIPSQRAIVLLNLLIWWTNLATFQTALALVIILEVSPADPHSWELLRLILPMICIGLRLDLLVRIEGGLAIFIFSTVGMFTTLLQRELLSILLLYFFCGGVVH